LVYSAGGCNMSETGTLWRGKYNNPGGMIRSRYHPQPKSASGGTERGVYGGSDRSSRGLRCWRRAK
jgi:hypothetical protein